MNIISSKSALSFCYLYIDITLKVIWILVLDFYLLYIESVFIDMKTTTMILLCDKCKKNEVQIYSDRGDCCISCWYDMTDPKIA
jgi:hypothetical protein